jgi:hypothetical protein
MAKIGRPRRPPTRMTRIPETIHKRLREIAKAEQLSVLWVAAHFIEKGLAATGGKIRLK